MKKPTKDGTTTGRVTLLIIVVVYVIRKLFLDAGELGNMLLAVKTGHQLVAKVAGAHLNFRIRIAKGGGNDN